MAQKIQTLLVDDIDGSEAEGTVRFGLDGAQYEIDLGERNAQKFAEVLKPYLAAARRIGDDRPKPPSNARIDRTQLAAMRSWARNHGYQVSDRGRVSQEIQDAYHSSK